MWKNFLNILCQFFFLPEKLKNQMQLSHKHENLFTINILRWKKMTRILLFSSNIVIYGKILTKFSSRRISVIWISVPPSNVKWTWISSNNDKLIFTGIRKLIIKNVLFWFSHNLSSSQIIVLSSWTNSFPTINEKVLNKLIMFPLFCCRFHTKLQINPGIR